MATDVEICNSAIAKVGAARILTLNDDSEEARLCKVLYPTLRDKLLRSHPWRFALKRVQLGQLVGAPTFDYAYRFQIPSDCLRVLDTSEYGDRWKQEGNEIVTDSSVFSILYIARVDESYFDANFTEVLAYQIAAEICMPLSNNATRSAELKASLKDELAQARSYSAQVGSVERVEADSWLYSRY